MKQLRRLCLAGLCVLALGVTTTGCKEDTNTPDGGENPGDTDGGTQETDGGGGGDLDAGTDGGTGNAEFTYFVRDLILNETKETNTPATIDDKQFVDTSPSDAFP